MRQSASSPGSFPNHEVVTVAEAEWRTLPDSKLVALAQGNFDVLIMIDRGFEFEHNLGTLTIGIVIVHVTKNRIDYYRPIFAELLAAAESVRPGEVIHVHAPPLS